MKKLSTYLILYNLPMLVNEQSEKLHKKACHMSSDARAVVHVCGDLVSRLGGLRSRAYGHSNTNFVTLKLRDLPVECQIGRFGGVVHV